MSAPAQDPQQELEAQIAALAANNGELLRRVAELEDNPIGGNWSTASGGGAANAVVVTPEEHGAVRNGIHDDTAAIVAAVNAAVAKGQANGSNYAEVVFTAGTYLVGSPSTVGGATKGNSQIPLPVISEEGPGFTLVLRGGVDDSPINYFIAVGKPKRGTTLHSTIVGVFSGEWGAPSVIGGPTRDGLGPGHFSNMLVVVDGLTVLEEKPCSLIAYDFSCMSEVKVGRVAALINATRAELEAEKVGKNELGVAMEGPLNGNGNNFQIDSLTVEGYFAGLALSSHLVCKRLLTVFTKFGLYVREPGTWTEGNVIDYFSFIAGTIAIEVEGPEEGLVVPFMIVMLQYEELESFLVHDAHNILHGIIFCCEGEHGAAPTVSGATHVKLVDLNKAPGKAAGTPTAAELEAGVVNPYWRDAAFTIENGEVIEVDGAPQLIPAAGGAATIFVPSGRTLKVKKVAGKVIAAKAVLL